MLVAWPFLRVAPLAYLTRAFDLGRVFEQRWSVNWQFLPASVFVSAWWALLLLLCTLLLWALLYVRVWSASSLSAVQTPLASSLLAGLLFARSLHYQFYAWYFFMMPLLLARTLLPLPLQYALFFCLELAYTRYPPTPLTSVLLVSAHALILCMLLWNGPVLLSEEAGASATAPVSKVAVTPRARRHSAARVVTASLRARPSPSQ